MELEGRSRGGDRVRREARDRRGRKVIQDGEGEGARGAAPRLRASHRHRRDARRRDVAGVDRRLEKRLRDESGRSGRTVPEDDRFGHEAGAEGAQREGTVAPAVLGRIERRQRRRRIRLAPLEDASSGGDVKGRGRGVEDEVLDRDGAEALVERAPGGASVRGSEQPGRRARVEDPGPARLLDEDPDPVPTPQSERAERSPRVAAVARAVEAVGVPVRRGGEDRGRRAAIDEQGRDRGVFRKTRPRGAPGAPAVRTAEHAAAVQPGVEDRTGTEGEREDPIGRRRRRRNRPGRPGGAAVVGSPELLRERVESRRRAWVDDEPRDGGEAGEDRRPARPAVGGPVDDAPRRRVGRARPGRVGGHCERRARARAAREKAPRAAFVVAPVDEAGAGVQRVGRECEGRDAQLRQPLARGCESGAPVGAPDDPVRERGREEQTGRGDGDRPDALGKGKVPAETRRQKRRPLQEPARRPDVHRARRGIDGDGTDLAIHDPLPRIAPVAAPVEPGRAARIEGGRAPAVRGQHPQGAGGGCRQDGAPGGSSVGRPDHLGGAPEKRERLGRGEEPGGIGRVEEERRVGGTGPDGRPRRAPVGGPDDSTRDAVEPVGAERDVLRRGPARVDREVHQRVEPERQVVRAGAAPGRSRVGAPEAGAVNDVGVHGVGDHPVGRCARKLDPAGGRVVRPVDPARVRSSKVARRARGRCDDAPEAPAVRAVRGPRLGAGGSGARDEKAPGEDRRRAPHSLVVRSRDPPRRRGP